MTCSFTAIDSLAATPTALQFHGNPSQHRTYVSARVSRVIKPLGAPRTPHLVQLESDKSNLGL